MWHIWGKREIHRVLVGKCEGNRPLARPRPSCGGNIKMDFRETGWESMDWIDLVQHSDKSWAAIKMVMNLWVL
jgi:hypothetical protein